MPRHFPFGRALLALLALCTASCSRKSTSERALARGEAYQAAGELDKAEVEYFNTLKADPKNGKAFAQLGLLYSDQGRIGKASSFLRRARELNPANTEVRAKLAVFYLATKQLDDARAEALFVLDHQPNHAEAPLLLVESALQPKDLAEAREFLQKLPTAQSAPVLTALAALEFHQQHIAEAEALLKKAQALDPKSAAVSASLGTVYLAQKNLKAAEAAFADAWQNSPVRSPQKLSYVRFKFESGDLSSARKMLTEIIAQVPDCLPPMLLLVEVNVREKKFDEALALAQKILARDQQNTAAMMLTARLLLAKGEVDKAQQTLDQLGRLQPKNPETHFQYAQTYLARGDVAKATASLTRALELAPGYAEAILLLTDLNLRKGDAKAAVATLKPFVAQHPELIAAKFLLARAFAGQGNYEEALANYREVATASPKDPTLLLPIALINRQQKNYDEAKKVLTKTLELAPSFAPAIEQLVDLDLLAGDNASARRRAEALLAKPTDQASAYLLLAKIGFAEKNLLQAETQLLKVIELQPDSSTAYYLLAGVYSQTNQDKKALTQLEQVSLKGPGSPALFMRIALLQERLKDYSAARAAYEKVLTLQSRFVPALNNLAYLQSEQFNDLERGLNLAQRARELEPFDPHIADTLGWILYRQGQYSRARNLLQEGAAKLPDDATIQFHAGMAQYMMGETSEARLALQRALHLDPALPGKDVVNQRLTILDADGTQSGPAFRATMEKAVAANKDDPVALTRLAVLLLGAGELDQAQKHFESALAVNPRNASATLGMIQLLVARHESARALELAKNLRQQFSDDPSVGHQLGHIAFQLGDYQWAASLLQESAGKLPDDADTLFDWAQAAYSVGRVADAESAFSRIQKTQPLSPRAGESSRWREMIALALKPTADSTVRINQALLADPSFVPALIAAGANAEFQSNPAAARQAYEQALAKYPDFTPAKRSLVLLSAAANDSDPKNYEMAVRIREALPNDPEVAEAVGILAYRKGEFPRSINLLKESIARLGEDSRRSYFLGLAQYRSKDPTARATLQRALALGLTDEAATEARRVLAELK